MSDRDYVHVGDHAEVLHSGRSIGPGDRVPPDELQEGDQYLVDEGRLVPDANEEIATNAPLSGEALQDRARELDIDGRSNMTADALRAAVSEAEGGEA